MFTLQPAPVLQGGLLKFATYVRQLKIIFRSTGRFRSAVPTKEPEVITIYDDDDDDDEDFSFPGFPKHVSENVLPIGIMSGRESEEFSAMDVD